MNTIDYDYMDMAMRELYEALPKIKKETEIQYQYYYIYSGKQKAEEFDLRIFENRLENLKADLWPREFRRKLEFYQSEKSIFEDYMSPEEWKESGVDKKYVLELIDDMVYCLYGLALDYIPELVEAIFTREDHSQIKQNQQKEEKGTPIIQISESLGADRKKVALIFNSLEEEGLLDKDFMPTFECTADKSFMAHMIADLLGVRVFWEFFGHKWNIKSPNTSYNQIETIDGNRKSLSRKRREIAAAFIKTIEGNDLLQTNEGKSILSMYKPKDLILALKAQNKC